MSDQVTVYINGKETLCSSFFSVAAAILGKLREHQVRKTNKTGEPRSIFCGMGVCYDCLVNVDGQLVRACMTQVRNGMRIQTQ